MASTSDFRTQLALLRRDPLKHAVILKYLLSTPGAVLHQVARGTRNASLLLLDPQLTSYDRRTYPEATASVLVASDDPALTRELMTHVSVRPRTFFRLPSEADRAVFAERFALDRRNAFLSFTGAGAAGSEGDAIIGTDATDAPYELYEQQEHERADGGDEHGQKREQRHRRRVRATRPAHAAASAGGLPVTRRCGPVPSRLARAVRR